MNWLQRGIWNLSGFENFIPQIIDPSTWRGELYGNSEIKQLNTDLLKIEAVLTNPAFLKVAVTLCDLFSLGEVYVYKKDKEQKKDIFLDFIKQPNFFQGKQQFLWDFMFWKIIGNAYCVFDSKILSADNVCYFLNSYMMDFPDEMKNQKDKIILSKKTYEKIGGQKIKYKYSDTTSTDLLWKNIVHIPDLSNGMGNWFKGGSKIDALYEVLANSKQSLISKNINAKYSGKYMVAGKADPNDIHQQPMAEEEKLDIEQKMNGRKKVFAVKSMIDIKRFVEKASILEELDKSYLTDYFIIGSLYGIPKDVLEGLNSSTFENQEKARAALVSYCLQPSGNQLMNAFENFFGISDREFVIDWEHLPFMQIVANERASAKQTTITTFKAMKDAGIKLEEINAFLDTNFSENENTDQPTGNNQGSGTVEGENQQQETPTVN